MLFFWYILLGRWREGFSAGDVFLYGSRKENVDELVG
jgi:hypothetical protein